MFHNTKLNEPEVHHQNDTALTNKSKIYLLHCRTTLKTIPQETPKSNKITENERSLQVGEREPHNDGLILSQEISSTSAL